MASDQEKELAAPIKAALVTILMVVEGNHCAED